MLLATRRESVEEFIRNSPPGTGLWIGGSVVSDDEIANFRKLGFAVSVFDHPIVTAEDIEDAKQIIAEHHPGEEILVDAFPAESSAPQSGSSAKSA